MSVAPIILTARLKHNPDGSLRTTNPAGDYNPQPVTLAVDKAAFSAALGSLTGLMQGGAATVPGAPTIGTAAAANASASVAFIPPASNGGSTITGYTATSTPGGLTGTGASSPITVNGLTNGTAYTFTVHATNAVGNSAESAASNSVTPSSSAGDAPAPTIGSAYQFGALAARIKFAPPATNGSTNVTGYRVYAQQSGSDVASVDVTPTRYQDEGNTANWQQLNYCADFKGLTGGQSYTFQVAAIQTAGVSPHRSASSAAVTILSAANYYMACGGGVPGRNPSWGDYSFGPYSSLRTNVAPGATSALYGQTAPTNPGNSTDNVVEMCIPSGANGAAWFPHIGHEGINGSYDNSQNGEFNIAAYTNRIVKIWPTVSGLSLYPNGLDKCLVIKCTVTTGGTGTFIDATQSAAFGNPGWPTNILNGALVWNMTRGGEANCSANTATSVSGMGTLVFVAGDEVEISIPDIAIGQSLSGTEGPSPLVAGTWNTVSFPLSTFNAGSGNYSTVTGDQILKAMCAFNAPSADAVVYICQDGFS